MSAGRFAGNVTTVAKKQRVAHFYESARLDGLLMRTEVFNVKLVEVFRDRDDRLVYRSATYDKVPPKPSTPPQGSFHFKTGGAQSYTVTDLGDVPNSSVLLPCI
eukprot:1181680-Prorocentrum_minimum.AAC.3